MVATTLSYLISEHLKLSHLGWKRLLVVVFIAITPIAIYIGYEIEHVNGIAETFLVITSSTAAAYCSVMLPFVGIKWVVEGFKQDPDNK